jgi:hypothetical protein
MKKEAIKVRFNLKGDPVAGELIWAKPENKDRYRLMNIPFYAVGYALDDVVRCRLDNGWQEVVAMEQDSGNGTIRLYFSDSANQEAQYILDELVSVGCEYEKVSSIVVAVSVPPSMEVSFEQLSNFLNDTSDKVLQGWEVGKRPLPNRQRDL